MTVTLNEAIKNMKKAKRLGISLLAGLLALVMLVGSIPVAQPMEVYAKSSSQIKEEINDVCAKILDNTSVFKKDAQGEEAFDKFLASVGIVKA